MTQQLLNEARAAYHRLMIGEQVVEVRDQNGEMIRYSRSDADKLKAYIKELENLLGISVNKPVRFWF